MGESALRDQTDTGGDIAHGIVLSGERGACEERRLSFGAAVGVGSAGSYEMCRHRVGCAHQLRDH